MEDIHRGAFSAWTAVAGLGFTMIGLTPDSVCAFSVCVESTDVVRAGVVLVVVGFVGMAWSLFPAVRSHLSRVLNKTSEAVKPFWSTPLYGPAVLEPASDRSLVQPFRTLWHRAGRAASTAVVTLLTRVKGDMAVINVLAPLLQYPLNELESAQLSMSEGTEDNSRVTSEEIKERFGTWYKWYIRCARWLHGTRYAGTSASRGPYVDQHEEWKDRHDAFMERLANLLTRPECRDLEWLVTEVGTGIEFIDHGEIESRFSIIANRVLPNLPHNAAVTLDSILLEPHTAMDQEEADVAMLLDNHLLEIVVHDPGGDHVYGVPAGLTDLVAQFFSRDLTQSDPHTEADEPREDD